jgi:hypothetical protein
MKTFKLQQKISLGTLNDTKKYLYMAEERNGKKVCRLAAMKRVFGVGKCQKVKKKKKKRK